MPYSEYERRMRRQRRRSQILGCAIMVATAIFVVFVLWAMITLAIAVFR
jgi:hypothetical protein